jgi:hypothetical protein
VQGHRVWVNVSLLALIAALGGQDESPVVESIQDGGSSSHFEFAESSPCILGTGKMPEGSKV